MKPSLDFTGGHWELRKNPSPWTHVWSRDWNAVCFYGVRVIRWTPHPETVDCIVSLSKKSRLRPNFSPLIVGKIRNKCVWEITTVSPHRECRMCDPHVTWHTLSQWRVALVGGSRGWYMIHVLPRTKTSTIVCGQKLIRSTNRRYTGVFLLYFGPLRTFRNSWRLAVAVSRGFYIGYIGKTNRTLAKAGGRRGWRSRGRWPSGS